MDSAHAVTPSGTAVSVIPAAAAAGSSGRRVLQVDGDVFMGDKIQTGPAGEAQIQFKDSTKLVVGPNSLMTIDAFVFNENNTARKITMNAAKGAFRFITGNSEKQAYTINTPTATIGVRGTQFDFTVAGSGEMTFAIFEGEARVCDRAGNCRDVRGGCEVVVTPPGGGVDPTPWTVPVAAKFPYVESQAGLLPAFRVSTVGCNGGRGTFRQRATDNNGSRPDRPERTASVPDTPAKPDKHHDPNCGYGEGEGEGQYGGSTARTASLASDSVTTDSTTTRSSFSRDSGGFRSSFGGFGSRDGKSGLGRNGGSRSSNGTKGGKGK